jgi:hypothetical protein
VRPDEIIRADSSGQLAVDGWLDRSDEGRATLADLLLRRGWPAKAGLSKRELLEGGTTWKL